MEYITVRQAAQKWRLSERTVRHHCSRGGIDGAFLQGNTWKIPSLAENPGRKERRKGTSLLLAVLKEEKKSRQRGGIYHRIQIDLTFNSNHMEGSALTHEQTRYIYETNLIGLQDQALNVDDIIETVNHFRCIDLMIERARFTLSEAFIKQLHTLLKSGTREGRKEWFAVGEYKRLPNEVGGRETTAPEKVEREIRELLSSYNAREQKSFDDILDFHVRFERIHPFQDGNGRVGRLIMFKECLRHGITPFIVQDSQKLFYYRGLDQWDRENEYLRDTCLTFQDRFREYLAYFRIDEK